VDHDNQSAEIRTIFPVASGESDQVPDSTPWTKRFSARPLTYQRRPSRWSELVS
jgi:hypothetical protein